MSQSDCKVVVQAWERELRQCFANIDIYVTVNNEEISETSYQWKFKQGTNANAIEIFPDDENFRKGTFRVLLVNRDEDEDEFTYQPLGLQLLLPKVP